MDPVKSQASRRDERLFVYLEAGRGEAGSVIFFFFFFFTYMNLHH